MLGTSMPRLDMWVGEGLKGEREREREREWNAQYNTARILLLWSGELGGWDEISQQLPSIYVCPPVTWHWSSGHRSYNNYTTLRLYARSNAVHCDIKLENIMLDSPGNLEQIKLIGKDQMLEMEQMLCCLITFYMRLCKQQLCTLLSR